MKEYKGRSSADERRISRRENNAGEDDRRDYRRKDEADDRRDYRRKDEADDRRDYRRKDEADDRRDYRRKDEADDRRDYRRKDETDNRRDYRRKDEADDRRDYRRKDGEDYRRNYRRKDEEDDRRDYRRRDGENNHRDYRRFDAEDKRRDYRRYDMEEDSRLDEGEGRDYRRSNSEAAYAQDKRREEFQGWNTGTRNDGSTPEEEIRKLDSGEEAHGILEVMPEGYGFIRNENYLPGEDDIYVSPAQIRRFNMKTGDVIRGSIRIRTGMEKFAALLYVSAINDEEPAVAENRRSFEDLTPIFPKDRIHLETSGGSVSTRIVDLLSPIGKGQRGMIVSPPKAGKTTLLKEIARAVKSNHPDMHLIILLIDERPEEVTDMKECIQGDNVEVIYSTFDELPEHHKRVSEMVLGRAKRLVEHGKDVIILLDSITRLARAYNLTVAPSGRTLSGGLDPAALHMPKKFFGAARALREGGSLTILATALVDTGSRMDDVVFEEFKGTGNMELVLDRKLSERRIFPAIDILRSGTRRDDLLLTEEEQEAVVVIRKGLAGMKQEDAVEEVLRLFTKSKNNQEFIQMAKKIRI